jgi:hypothetical protein
MCHPAFAWRPAVASGYRARVATPLQPQLVKELDAALAKLESTDPAAAGPHWGAMHKLLLKAKVDPQALMRIVGARDVAELKRAVARAKGEEVPEAAAGEGTGSGAASADAAASASSATHAPDIELPVLQDALRMFRKRLKLMQLDADSKIGHGPMSGTGQHRIQSMVPPRDFPIAVWEALARMGKLRREGDGFYSLIEQTGAHW